MAEHHASASDEAFAATLDWALRLVLVIALPAAIGLGLLAEPMIEHAVLSAASSARATSRWRPRASWRIRAGLLGFILVKVLSPGYFSRQDTRTPVRIGVQALGLSMMLSITFVLALLRTGWAPPHAGLAAATTCSGLFNSAVLLTGLLRSGVYRPRPGWRSLTIQVFAASLLMAGALSIARSEIGSWLALGAVGRVAALVACVGGGSIVYFGACYVFGLRFGSLRLGTAASGSQG